MTFTEDKALEIVNLFNLNQTIIPMWRFRNIIPDKYFLENYQIPIKSEREHKVLIEQITTKIIANEKINVKYLCEISGIKDDKIQDIKKGKTKFSQQDLLSIKKQINLQRINLKSILTSLEGKILYTDKDSLQIRQILMNPLIVIRPFLQLYDITEQRKLYEWKRNPLTDIPNHIKNKIIQKTAIFILETTLP